MHNQWILGLILAIHHYSPYISIEPSTDQDFTIRGATTYDYRLLSSSEKLISDTYTGIVTKTSAWAFNAGKTINGVEVGASYTYSSSKQFKTYKRVRDITAKYAVYTRMGHFVRYETVTVRVTTTYHKVI